MGANLFNRKLFAFVVALCSFFVSIAQTGVPRIVINPKGHSAKVRNLLYTPDGQNIVTISEDKTILIWDVSSGKITDRLEGNIGDGWDGMLFASAISPNGRILAVAGFPNQSQEENHIILIDLKQKVQIATAIGHTDVIGALDFSGDGKFLVSGGDDGKVMVWEMGLSRKLKTVATFEVGSPVLNLSLNKKTDALAVATQSKNITVADLSGFKSKKYTQEITAYKKHKSLVHNLKYSPDGKYLGSVDEDNTLIVWDHNGNDVLQLDDFSAPLTTLAFSYDSKIMVLLDVNGKGYSYAIPGGNKYSDDFKGHNNTVFCAAFSPQSADGNYLVASAGGTRNEILLWNAISAKTVAQMRGQGDVIYDLKFGSGMELFISNTYSSGNDYEYHYSFDFSSFILSRDVDKTRIVKSDENKLIKEVGDGFTLDLGKGNIIRNDQFEDGRILSFTSNNKGQVVIGSDYSLKMYNKTGNILKEFLGHTGGIRAVALSPDGKYLASGSEDQTIRLWKLDEAGQTPSMRDIFQEEDWINFFETLEVDSLTKQPSRKAWEGVINYLRNQGNKISRDIEVVFNSIGEIAVPFASFFLAEDGEWICWTPGGYFSCSPGGSDYFGWHINNGIEKLADYYSAEQYFEILYRPNYLSKSFSEAKRVEEILRENGEKIFDLSKLSRPSAGFFNVNSLTIGENKIMDYEQGKYITQQKRVPITVDLYDGGGGIREINLFQNGKLIVHDTEVKSLQEKDQITRSYEVDLVNDINNFKLIVVNYQKTESRPDFLKIEYSGETIVSSTLHILTVGINEYEREEYNLNYAYDDAHSFTRKLIENSEGMFKSDKNKIELYNSEATKGNIIQAFETIINQAKPEDMFVFYYAGHGTIDERGDNDYYLVPTDVTQLYGDSEQLHEKGVSATQLKELLAQIKTTRQVIIMDACHSGKAVDAFSGGNSKEKIMRQFARSSGIVMLTSSNSQQFASEFEVLKHGVFTYALLDAIDGKADTGDKEVSIFELKLYMDRVVPRLSKQYGGVAQKPLTYLVVNDDFPIARVRDTEEEN